ncbi:MAG: LacI family transcriptional regulator [Clostridiaceae bacterium]|jgi:LacI family transcriptional regulator|nr:LacI family transcriptional regulator [Clostridiaceae bacterium]
MASTIKDVAKRAGVSTATVSRVINGDPRISSKTKEKVLISIRELDYKINNIARSLKTNKTHTIGFICPELANTFFMTVAKGVEDELRKYGYSVIVCNSNESVEEEKERITLLLEKCVDGVIIIPASHSGSHFKDLTEQGIPVVLADRLVEDFSSDAVLVDNINGSYAVIEHLINSGYRRIGYIGGDIRLTSAKERDEGYKRALRDYLIPIDDNIIKYGDYHKQSGYDKMRELMEEKDPPEIVFISNYYMHVGATKFLIEQKEANRRNVAIASFDDMELASLLEFCKVLVSQPMLEIGNKAAGMLIQRINDSKDHEPQIIRLKTQLIVK